MFRVLMTAGMLAIAVCLSMVGQSSAEKREAMSEKPKNVRVAICQTLCIDSDLMGNLKRIENALEVAAREKAELACFPETALLGWVNPDAHKMATPIPGKLSEHISKFAKRFDMMISIGLAEREDGKLYDSAILVDRDGKILLKHRKMNTLTELLDPPYTRGKPEEVEVADTRFGRIGMLICADTFIGDLVEGIGKLEPDLLIVPYGWAADVDEWPDHGKNLTTTVSRASDWAGCSVVGTDLVGMISKGPWTGKTYGGQSVAVDTQGEVITVLRDRDVDVQVVEVPLGRR
jgi:N-carbamoylputrescine amidase